jgi:hypothetical protein
MSKSINLPRPTALYGCETWFSIFSEEYTYTEDVSEQSAKENI